MTMSKLRGRPNGTHGRGSSVTSESAGWSHVGFDLHRLGPGERVAAETGDREACLVLVSGKARIEAGGHDFGVTGERMSPFEGKPHSIYVPAGSHLRVEAATDLTLAVCTAPGGAGTLPPRLIGPDDVTLETRGRGTNRSDEPTSELQSLMRRSYAVVWLEKT